MSKSKNKIEQEFKDLEDLRRTNIVLSILQDKKVERIRRKTIDKTLETNMTSDYMKEILSTMYELLTKFSAVDSSNPISGNGLLANDCGYHTILYNTIESSQDEKYIKINDTNDACFVFPVEVFKYSNNIKKRDRIFREFLDRCLIVELQKSIGESNRRIQFYDQTIASEIKDRNKNIAKLDRLIKKKIEPLYLTEIKFNNKKEHE